MTYLITSATGNQGSSIIRTALSSSSSLKIHALTRDPASINSLALQALGATLFEGSFSNIASLEAAAKGATHLFLNVSPSPVPGRELQDARNVIEASLKEGIKHIIYSSVLNTGQHTSFPGWDKVVEENGFTQNYWESKHGIEELVRGAGFETWTILRPGFFTSNLIGKNAAIMFPELASEGVFKSAYKPETKLSLLDTDDIGKVVLKVWENPGKWNGKEIDVIGESLRADEAVRILQEVSGKQVRFEGIKEDESVEGFRGLIAASQRFIVKIDETGKFESNLEPLKELGVHLKNWRQFLVEQQNTGELEKFVGGKY